MMVEVEMLLWILYFFVDINVNFSVVLWYNSVVKLSVVFGRNEFFGRDFGGMIDGNCVV